MSTDHHFGRIAAVVGFIASVIAIYVFVSGRQSIADLLSGPKEPRPASVASIGASPPQMQTNAPVPEVKQSSVADSPTPPAPAETPHIPAGSFPLNTQVAVFGSGFYGRHTPLYLQSIENVPGSRLSLHFLIENEDEAAYYFTLENPRETAVAIDDTRNYYSFLSAKDIESVTPIEVPAGGRRRSDCQCGTKGGLT
jgi:hypothetical protein